ncbi:VOC family protein [Pectobacterium polaris]|uniref:VOC family protein n=1 Tax=Pectobacterium polaris TaxID=2042057 RepID=A0AAW5GK37_9GAMM|nr:VOC family protein [Pectobacterium polaris]ASY75336.1 prolyl endopeptidase [Pectobacterium polaris]MCL6353477.1 VOC family protein [Pectobacterium polaris]MCL6370898.1 VOC family protein [Pectobacterium polaris]MDE8753514.1 VOC family protein [Pectobacterium polaris]MDG0802239.1 VOC family protein [Pectobacterium polaris]
MNFHHLRIARPVSNLKLSCEMYCRGLDLKKLGSFSDHEGFSGAMLGCSDLGWHLEFTQCHHHPVSPSPSDEDLLVLYIVDKVLWDEACSRMDEAGFARVSSFNPYWDKDGVTFHDHDGYRIVIQNRQWE